MVGLPTAIFDIDGTLANIEHRRHYVMNKPKNWKKFNDMMIHDTPNMDIISILILLKNAGNKIVLASGREDRETTETWLNTIHSIPYDKLYMRHKGDYRPDDLIKQEILIEIRQDGFDPWIVFDDRQKVVDMWRREGLRCLQVAEGNF